MKFGRVKRIPRYLFRNQYKLNGMKVARNKINLEYYTDVENLGDMLSPVIVEYMLDKKGILIDQNAKTGHLLAVGSIIGHPFDATIWGAGVMSFAQAAAVYKWKKIRKYDIRCVRGPLSANVLKSFGYSCPDVYGDPAVLMPFIHAPLQGGKEYDVVYISHFHNKSIPVPEGVKCLDINTSDYRTFIDEICKAKKVISSSLHGIILAETYGVPAIFHAENRENEIIKYYDWYYSTERYSVSMAMSMEEAMAMPPMLLPDVSQLQNNLLNTFPYDLWGK